MDNKNYIGYNAAVASGDSKPQETGLTPPEDDSKLKDREVNVVLSRDDDGCKDAYENCIDVYNNVDRLISLYNSGIVVGSVDKEKYTKQIRYLEEKKVEFELDRYLDSLLINRELYYIGAWAKRKIGNKIQRLIGINTMKSSRISYEFIPIVNSYTGELGIEKIDPDNPEKNVIAIQRAAPKNYDMNGNETEGQLMNTYYDKESLMLLSYSKTNIHGKGVSPVRRSLRYAEGLMRLENTVLLLARRPTQLIYTAGNENHNLMSCAIPQSYLEDADGDSVQARINYKTAKLAALATEAKKLTAGNVLAQTLEYGTSVTAIEVPEGLPYVDYMKYFAEKIKMCILPVDIPTQRIVRSSAQETNTSAELFEKAESEQRKIKDWLNKNLTSELLKEVGGATIAEVYYEFEPIEKEHLKDKATFWSNIARATKFFTDSNIEFPEEFVNIMNETNLQIKTPKKEENDEEVLNAIEGIFDVAGTQQEILEYIKSANNGSQQTDIKIANLSQPIQQLVSKVEHLTNRIEKQLLNTKHVFDRYDTDINNVKKEANSLQKLRNKLEDIIHGNENK